MMRYTFGSSLLVAVGCAPYEAPDTTVGDTGVEAEQQSGERAQGRQASQDSQPASPSGRAEQASQTSTQGMHGSQASPGSQTATLGTRPGAG